MGVRNCLIGAVMALAALTSTAVASGRDNYDCDNGATPDIRIAACTRALPGARIPAFIYNSRGIAFEAKGEYDHAIADFDEAIRLRPDYSYAYNNRGVTWGDKGQYDRGIADLNESIRLNPKYAIAFNARGMAHERKGAYDLAIADYTEAIRIDPKDAAYYTDRGQTFDKMGQYDRAIVDHTEAIRLRPRASGSYNDRGFSWMNKGEYARALADYNEAIRLDPKRSSTTYENRALVWQQMGDFTRAIADCDEAIRLNPKNSAAYAFRGAASRLSGDLDRALADQTQAITIAPDAYLPYNARGDTFRYKGEFDRAIADYTSALQRDADNVPALTGLGLTYERMGDLAAARAKFEQAAKPQDRYRLIGISKEALETARARLAALDSGVAPPTIPVTPSKAASATSIPTPAIATPTVPADIIKATVARQGRRVALVIGNSGYVNVPVLANPQNDAEAIAASLRNIGFESVTLANNTTREKLVDSLRAFANEAENADWAMVYFAGHGLEVGGINYLVPVDAKLAVDRDIQFEAVPLDQVLAAVDSAKRLKLVVLDACRDNPFSPRQTMAPAVMATASRTSAGGATITSRSIGRGLAEVQASGATLVVFAAKNGQVALDGDGKNSPFAVAVLQRIATPGVEINKLFRLVRDDVMEATAGRQEPYTYGSLPGREEFFFVEK